MEVRFDGEIGVHSAHPNFHRWKMLGALPHTKYSEDVL
jgi:hypothetical protein